MHTMKPATKTQRADAIGDLRNMLKPGDTVYVSTKSVSSSGMSRRVTVHVIQPGDRLRQLKNRGGYNGGGFPEPDPADYELESITWLVARALGYPLVDADTWQIRLGGAGMDMHFHLVYSLGRALFGANGERVDGRDAGYALNKVSI